MNSTPPAALARVEHTAAIEPRNMTELKALATDAAESKLFAVQTPQQAMMILMAGRDLGLSYAQSMRAFHIIENRPSLSADGMVAVCLCRRDLCEYFRVVESTDERCTVETKRTGNPPRTFTFTIADAERAELIKSNRNGGKGMWQKYPSRMLLARAKSALAREVYTDLLLGLYDPDEIEAAPAPPRQVEVQAEVVESSDAARLKRELAELVAQLDGEGQAKAETARAWAGDSPAKLAHVIAKVRAKLAEQRPVNEDSEPDDTAPPAGVEGGAS